MPDIRLIQAAQPDNDIISAAAGILRRGGLIVFPTQGLYGLGADALNSKAVERVFDLKGRVQDKPLLVLISSRQMLARVVPDLSPLAVFYMNCFWPGNLTLVLKARPDLPQGLCSPSGKIGVRLTAHPVAAALVDKLGGPVTGTSANRSEQGGCATVAELEALIRDSADMVLDAGPLAGGPGSTVLDVSGQTPLILRHGAVPADEINQAYAQFRQSVGAR
jgi:L-threonylcarbamoyladenylate synthase